MVAVPAAVVPPLPDVGQLFENLNTPVAVVLSSPPSPPPGLSAKIISCTSKPVSSGSPSPPLGNLTRSEESELAAPYAEMPTLEFPSPIPQRTLPAGVKPLPVTVKVMVSAGGAQLGLTPVIAAPAARAAPAGTNTVSRLAAASVETSLFI